MIIPTKAAIPARAPIRDASTTFAGALTAYERQAGISLDAFRDELEALGIATDSVAMIDFCAEVLEISVTVGHRDVYQHVPSPPLLNISPTPCAD